MIATLTPKIRIIQIAENKAMKEYWGSKYLNMKFYLISASLHLIA